MKLNLPSLYSVSRAKRILAFAAALVLLASTSRESSAEFEPYLMQQNTASHALQVNRGTMLHAAAETTAPPKTTTTGTQTTSVSTTTTKVTTTAPTIADEELGFAYRIDTDGVTIIKYLGNKTKVTVPETIGGTMIF